MISLRILALQILRRKYKFRAPESKQIIILEARTRSLVKYQLPTCLTGKILDRTTVFFNSQTLYYALKYGPPCAYCYTFCSMQISGHLGNESRRRILIDSSSQSLKICMGLGKLEFLTGIYEQVEHIDRRNKNTGLVVFSRPQET